MNRLAITAAIAAAAAVPAIAVASDTPSGPTAPISPAAIADYVATEGVSRFIDNKPKGDSGGDVFAETFNLQGGGVITNVCTLVRPGKHSLAQCQATLLRNGSALTLSGVTTGSKVTRDAILGGTGPYKGAAGTVTFTPAGKTIKVHVETTGR